MKTPQSDETPNFSSPYGPLTPLPPSQVLWMKVEQGQGIWVKRCCIWFGGKPETPAWLPPPPNATGKWTRPEKMWCWKIRPFDSEVLVPPRTRFPEGSTASLAFKVPQQADLAEHHWVIRKCCLKRCAGSGPEQPNADALAKSDSDGHLDLATQEIDGPTSPGCITKCCWKQVNMPDKRRRLPSIEEPMFEPSSERRLAAIPLPGVSTPPQSEIEPGAISSSTLPAVGVVSSALCLAGCFVRRCYRQVKKRIRRDSFGFQPDSQRTSLDDAEMAV